MNRRILIYIGAVVIGFLISFAVAYGAQEQPDAKRVKEIHDALVANGYAVHGNTWKDVQDATREIADAHKWQVTHAPDARVLGCFLHLGNIHFDPDVCTGRKHLDEAQRHEK